MRKFSTILCMLLAVACLTGCAAAPAAVEIPDESLPLIGAPAGIVPTSAKADTSEKASEKTSAEGEYTFLNVSAPGKAAAKNDAAVIDYSNAAEGYVMVQYKQGSDARLKAQVKGPKSTYTYDLTPKTWAAFPFSEGSGAYKVTIFRNVSGSKYATVLSATVKVSLKDEFGPFLYPNQYVDFTDAPDTVKKAAELAGDVTEPLELVALVYDYVVDTLSYDKSKAQSVKSGYLPALDEVLAARKGICFDYAALMAAMLRSRGVPCKLVVGYAGDAYHAWINVWTEESGWIDGVIFFDGKTWMRMDPTFASSGKRSDSIMKYIGNGSNYKEKYLY